MAEPSRVRMASRLPERSEKCSRVCATGASYWPGGWRAQREDEDGPRRASPLRIRQDNWSGPHSIGGGLLRRKTRPNGGKFVNQRSMQFLERSRIFTGEKRCCRIARMFESGMKYIELN